MSDTAQALRDAGAALARAFDETNAPLQTAIKALRELSPLLRRIARLGMLQRRSKGWRRHVRRMKAKALA